MRCAALSHIAAPASTIWATRASQFHSSHLALAGHIFLNHQLFEPQLLFQLVLVWCLPKWRELAQPPVRLIYRKEEINFSTKFGTITVSILIDSRRFEVSQGTTNNTGKLEHKIEEDLKYAHNLEAANHLGLVALFQQSLQILRCVHTSSPNKEGILGLNGDDTADCDGSALLKCCFITPCYHLIKSEQCVAICGY